MHISQSCPDSCSVSSSLGDLDDSLDAGVLLDCQVIPPCADDVMPSEEQPTVEMFDRRRDNFIHVYLRRLKGAGQCAPKIWAPTVDALPSMLFPCIALMILNVIETFGLNPHHMGMESFITSMGSSCPAALCLITTPGSQPRGLIGTQVTAAFLGVSWKHICLQIPHMLGEQLATAFSVAMLTAGMMLTDALQPSSSATASIAAFQPYGLMNDQGYMFMVTPAALGPAVIVCVGWLLNNLVPWRRPYPLWW